MPCRQSATLCEAKSVATTPRQCSTIVRLRQMEIHPARMDALLETYRAPWAWRKDLHRVLAPEKGITFWSKHGRHSKFRNQHRGRAG